MLRRCLYPMCSNTTHDRFCDKHAEHEQKARRRCVWPGCPELIQMSKRYCEVHERLKNQQYDEERGNARSRGYTKQWDKVSKAYREKFPLCQDCEAQGKVTPAIMVHHIKPVSEGGEWFDESNLRSLCASCHARKPGHGRR